MYKNAEELLNLCNLQGKRIWEVALDNEVKLTGMSRTRVMQHFSERLEIMFNSALKALDH